MAVVVNGSAVQETPVSRKPPRFQWQLAHWVLLGSLGLEASRIEGAVKTHYFVGPLRVLHKVPCGEPAEEGFGALRR